MGVRIEWPEFKNEYVRPFAVHTAESKWQFCMCLSCQTKRLLLDSMPGQKIDYRKFRLAGEHY